MQDVLVEVVVLSGLIVVMAFWVGLITDIFGASPNQPKEILWYALDILGSCVMAAFWFIILLVYLALFPIVFVGEAVFSLVKPLRK